MTKTDRSKAAREFADRWRGRGYEKGDTQVFWTELLQSVCGFENVSQRVEFERHTSDGGYIDVLIPGQLVLVEQKGLGVDLDKPEERQGKMVTPFEQAFGYATSFSLKNQPQFIITCNFQMFRVYDRTRYSDNHLSENAEEFTLDELGDDPHLLDFICNPNFSTAQRETDVSIKAGKLVAKLYKMLLGQYIDPDSPESRHSLNVLCVRLVFCLFCEDVEGLFPKDALHDYLQGCSAAHMRRGLLDLFEVLDTPLDKRDPYLEPALKTFPYVDGGLFAEPVEIPNFTEEIRLELVLETSQKVDWSGISPTVFGGIFESTLNPETRHEQGMHYTSPENIHKVIDPLFLDGLYDEFSRLRRECEGLTEKKRTQKFEAFLEKLGSLRFLDPAFRHVDRATSSPRHIFPYADSRTMS